MTHAIRLCFPRPGSDGVLVAALAAVRKIHRATAASSPSSGPGQRRPHHQDHLEAAPTDLVEPKLVDSFLIFSSKGGAESFV